MELYQILLIVIGCLLFVSFVVIFFISIFVTRKIVYPHRYTKKEQDSYNKKMGYDKGFETL